MKVLTTLVCGVTCLCGSFSVMAGSWMPARTLEGPFAVSSPPIAPSAGMNGSGHALLAWSSTGVVTPFSNDQNGVHSSSPGGVGTGGTGSFVACNELPGGCHWAASALVSA